jgi:serine/tyrosine/threonine adenylyltransferase
MTYDDPAPRVAPLDLPWRPADASGLTQLGSTFATPTAPTALPAAHWVARNERLRADLRLPSEFWTQHDTLQALTGNVVLTGSSPYASVYSGHQFGQWAGQLGDGRALNLGDIDTPFGPQTLQLKGAGPTPYSRRGDGRAVLRSSIREYLASEAMHGLGVATTRALCVTGSPGLVRREEVETAAVVTRVAPSFVRFGHFEHFASNGLMDELQALADWVVAQHMPHLQALQGPARYTGLLQAITHSTAELMAQWQAVGFCHGVMNTDNMSVLGLTLDYGPFQFLDAFDPSHICNHSDHQGRYAYARQPQVAYWNLFCLGQALMPLIDEQAPALAALERYKDAFPAALDARMRAKLGLHNAAEGDRALVETLLKAMHQDRVDYTVFWRRLSHAVGESASVTHAFEPVRDLFLHREVFDAWLSSYQTRMAADCATGDAASSDLSPLSNQARSQAMLQVNPKFILRNHLGELAIRQAKTGDFSMVQDLCDVLHQPFDEHPAFEAWAGLAPEWASSIEISCSS